MDMSSNITKLDKPLRPDQDADCDLIEQRLLTQPITFRHLDVDLKSQGVMCAVHNDATSHDEFGMQKLCPYCGSPFVQGKTKTRRFCSDACRLAWWAKHKEQGARRTQHTCICAYCGAKFTVYGNTSRKYCSHNCYIADRFRDKASEHDSFESNSIHHDMNSLNNGNIQQGDRTRISIFERVEALEARVAALEAVVSTTTIQSNTR